MLLGGPGTQTAHLDRGPRERVALAVACPRCDGCITTHADAGLKQNASRWRIADTFDMALAFNAGAALVYPLPGAMAALG